MERGRLGEACLGLGASHIIAGEAQIFLVVGQLLKLKINRVHAFLADAHELHVAEVV